MGHLDNDPLHHGIALCWDILAAGSASPLSYLADLEDFAEQTLAGRKILSAPVVGAPEGEDPTTFTTNAPGQDVVCFVDIRDVRFSSSPAPRNADPRCAITLLLIGLLALDEDANISDGKFVFVADSHILSQRYGRPAICTRICFNGLCLMMYHMRTNQLCTFTVVSPVCRARP